MVDKIHNRDFRSPSTLSKLPCVAADRFLEKVDEQIKILNVCQDEQNPSIVWIEFSLNGVFDYTPTCFILKVDEDASYQQKEITVPIVLNYYRNTSKTLPLNTNCKTKTYTLAFDFGIVIQNYLGSSEIIFKLQMLGVIPVNLNLPDFKNLTKTINDQFTWQKGPTPSPYRLVYDSNNEKLSIYFDFNTGYPCNCNITCQTLSGNLNNIQYCEDKISRITVDYANNTDPQNLLLQFSDALGNFKQLNILPLMGVETAAPSVSYIEMPKRIEVAISRASLSGTKLDGAAYQIWKYQQTEGTQTIWKDWSYRDYSSFVDFDVIPGQTYGYAVRYKGKFGEDSNLSAWSTVSLPL